MPADMSADMAIAQAVNPTGVDPLILYAAREGATSPSGSRSRRRAPARCVRRDQNPYTLYSKLVGLTTTTSSGGGTTTTDPVAAELAATRKSVNDLVRAELNSLMGMLGA